MNFYYLADDQTSYSYNREVLLRQAAKSLKVKFVPIIANQVSVTRLPALKKDDLLYRATPGYRSKLIEKILLSYSPVTFYRDVKYGLLEKRISPFFYLSSSAVPTVPFLGGLPRDRKEAKKFMEYLEGPPLTFKIVGGSHGVGVIKVDSFDAFISLVDFLRSTLSSSTTVLVRKYIKHQRQARLVVVGDRVVAGHVNLKSSDFRTNVEEKKRRREVVAFDNKVQQVAVAAVSSLGLELGGVDVLFEEKTGKLYVSEVNFPFYFPTTQELTKINIAREMIAYLVQKSKRS